MAVRTSLIKLACFTVYGLLTLYFGGLGVRFLAKAGGRRMDAAIWVTFSFSCFSFVDDGWSCHQQARNRNDQQASFVCIHELIQGVLVGVWLISQKLSINNSAKEKKPR